MIFFEIKDLDDINIEDNQFEFCFQDNGEWHYLYVDCDLIIDKVKKYSEREEENQLKNSYDRQIDADHRMDQARRLG